MIEQPTNDLILPLEKTHDVWATYKVFVAFDAADPHKQDLIYIGAERLCELYLLGKLRTNSEFIRIMPFVPNGHMRFVIAATGAKVEMLNHATRLSAAMTPRPRCNLMGHTLQSATRSILCSNGETYKSQLDAAESLGLSQGAISRHLRGKLNSVKGYTFTHI